VAKAEQIQLPSQLASRLAQVSNGNLRKALLTMETAKVQQYPFQDNQSLLTTDWEAFIHGIAMTMIKEQSPAW
jgi:replication factor C subunit 3/5